MAILCCASQNSLRGTGHVKWVILSWGAIPPAALQSRLLPEVPKPNTASRQISWAVGPASCNCLVTSTPSTPSHPIHPPGRRSKFLIRQPLVRSFKCLQLASFPLAPLKHPGVTLRTVFVPNTLFRSQSLCTQGSRAGMAAPCWQAGPYQRIDVRGGPFWGALAVHCETASKIL